MSSTDVLRQYILVYGSFDSDSRKSIDSTFQKNKEQPKQKFPSRMPIYMTKGLQDNGIHAIDLRFHEIIMNEYLSVIKENPSKMLSDDLPINEWIDIFIRRLREKFIIAVIQC